MPKRSRSKGRKRVRRKVNTRKTRRKFLIVCEGEKTEPNYFKRFRVPKNLIEVIGVGSNTTSLVKEAMRLMEQGQYDQVWCVFDRDSFPAQNFNNAIRMAKAHNINLAYSNEAFELWYILHFNYHDSAISRSQYANMLKKSLGTRYKKNSLNMYELLESRQANAIRNAEKLLNSYTPHNPAKDNPCTTVHHLVQELNKFAV